MELLNVLQLIPLPVLLLAMGILLIVTVILLYQYLKLKGLEGIRADVYHLILEAEYRYKESGQGKQKLKWVVQQARGLLPEWLQWFMTEEMLANIIDKWFLGVKDLLDDGKVNGSSHES